MDFWTRVDVEDATLTQTGTGNVQPTWAVFAEDVEARVLPLIVEESVKEWATPEEDAYEIHLRGAWPSIRPRMRVIVGADPYDIRHVILPPPFGTPTTVLQTVRVTP